MKIRLTAFGKRGNVLGVINCKPIIITRMKKLLGLALMMPFIGSAFGILIVFFRANPKEFLVAIFLCLIIVAFLYGAYLIL